MNAMSNLTRLVDEALAMRWEASPASATSDGIRGYDHLIGDYSTDAVLARVAASKGLVRSLRGLPTADLQSRDAELDYKTLLNNLEADIEEIDAHNPYTFDPSIYPLIAIRAVHVLFMKDLPQEYRADMVRARTEGVPDVLADGMAQLTRPDFVLSQVAMRTAIGGVQFFEEAVRPHAPEAARQAQRALVSFAQFVREKLLPRAGLAYPTGRELFEVKLRKEHGIEMSAAALAELGYEEIARTREDLKEAASRIDRGADWHDVLDKVERTVPRPEDLLDTYRAATDAARRFVIEHDLLRMPRNETLRIEPTPEYERDTIPFAAMMPPGAFEERRESTFWVTPVDPRLPRKQLVERLRHHNVYSIPSTCVHEAYPGHHVQLTRCREIPSKVRRVYGTPVFIEGWAFYCEQLAEETGFLEDPRQRLQRLKGHLWRACRIVVDVGLHTRKMSYEAAVQFLTENAGLDKAGAQAEVNRYCGSPTQPMSYVMGAREIRRLRDMCHKAWGREFTLRRFHDWLLDFGNIPPSYMTPYIEPA
jgi:uncharacterized protein (DUF885 family)